MAITQKDEMIIFIQEATDGFATHYFLKNNGRFTGRDIIGFLKDQLDPATDTYDQRISADKTSLKTEIASAIDNYLGID